MSASVIGAAAAIAAVVGCAASGSVPVTANDARWANERWPGTTLADLSHGREVFTSRCSSCHGLPSPDAKSPGEWNAVLDEMASRAKLSSTDRELVRRYLSATSERLRARPASTQAAAERPEF